MGKRCLSKLSHTSTDNESGSRGKEEMDNKEIRKETEEGKDEQKEKRHKGGCDGKRKQGKRVSP